MWYQDLSFTKLNKLINQDTAVFSAKGLRLEPPHLSPSPYIVEGYHITDAQYHPIDILPKGIEIRTPVTNDLHKCLQNYKKLYSHLVNTLDKSSYRLSTLSHHPVANNFSGPKINDDKTGGFGPWKPCAHLWA